MPFLDSSSVSDLKAPEALSYEYELLALAVSLYLYDSTVLLYANEAILSCDSRHVWHASTGWSGFVVAGRRVCVLNPLMMYRPCVRLSWNLYAVTPSDADKSWSEELRNLQSVAPLTVIAALALFVLLPLGLFTRLGTHLVLGSVALLYGSILLALLFIRWRYSFRALTGLRFAGLIFECLACPPFGVNLIRRVALANRVKEPLLFAAARLLPACEWNALRAHCVATLDQELWRLEESSPERRAVEEQRARLSAWIQQK